MVNKSAELMAIPRVWALGMALLALVLSACDQGGGGSLSITEDSDPGDNAFRVSAIADIDTSVDGARINEDAQIGAAVGLTAFASDEDATNNTVRYVLTDNAGGRFAINSETGVVTLAAKASSSNSERHTITVTASSIDGSSSSAEFNIRVLPSNRFDVTTPTDTNNAPNTVDISASVGTEIGITANAVDQDLSLSDVRYSLSNNAGGRFAIDPETGVVTLAGSVAADSVSVHTIEVTATSEDTSSATAMFTITVVLGDKPVISIRFPSTTTITDADRITVSGGIRLSENRAVASFTAAIGDGAPTPVNVNDDNSWIFVAALVADRENVIEFTLSDDAISPATEQNTTTTAISITHFSPPQAPPESIPMTAIRGLALDATSKTVYVVDAALPGIYAVDLTTNVNRVFSVGGAAEDQVGTGAAFSDSDSRLRGGLEGGIALDAANNRLLVTDNGNDNIIAVSLASGSLGNRSVFSSATQTGPAIVNPFGIVVDSANNRALYVDTGPDAVIAVDLTTGNRTMIAELGSTSSARDLVLDATNNRILVADAGSTIDAVRAVALSDGMVTVVSSAITGGTDNTGIGTGAGFGTSRGIVLDSTNNQVLVADSAGVEGIVAVDLATGNRETLSGPGAGASLDAGSTFADARDVIIDSSDAENIRYIVADDDLDELVAVDPATGDRAFIQPAVDSNIPDLGTGPKLTNPSGIVFDVSSNQLYVSESASASIIAVNLNNGIRTTLNDTTGAGEMLFNPRGLAFNADRTALLVPANAPSGPDDIIFSVSLSTGAASIFSDNTGFEENADPLRFASPRGHIAAESATSILVADSARDSLFRINTVDGSHAALAADATTLAEIQSVVLDSDNNRALVSTGAAGNNDALDSITAVSLSDGALTVLSSQAPTGTGPDLGDPRGLVLDAGNERLLVVDNVLKALVAVDITTGATAGNRTIVADATTGGGNRLSNFEDTDTNSITAIALDDERRLVYVVGASSPEVIQIDLISGDQVVISR